MKTLSINTSIFELFKVGPGPSSSHTLAPMLAGNNFIHYVQQAFSSIELRKATHIIVRLFGSLSATGKGHGTDAAVLAGLLGENPATCEPNFLDNLDYEKAYSIKLKDVIIPFTFKNIHFDAIEHQYPYSNTMIIMLFAEKECIFEREYYSVGGGFLQWKGWEPPLKGKPIHVFSTMSELVEYSQKTNIPLPLIILQNEQAITGSSEENIKNQLVDIIHVMCDSVQLGLTTKGLLKGPYGLERRAPVMLSNAMKLTYPEERFIACLSAYGQAAEEENAQGHKIVTAPTAGSSGVLPALVYMLIHHRKYTFFDIIDPLLVAAVIGILAKTNASISGSEVGCQGEIGVASAMAAAFAAQAAKKSIAIIENAAEIALEHHLGLTCDPIGGYVQVPCISRCAMATVHAWNAYLMASTGIGTKHPLKLDVTIQAMVTTGKDMNSKYRETAKGGLATAFIHC